MRLLFNLSAITAGIFASRPVNEALLNTGFLETYIFVASSHDPDTMPKSIPESVGGRNMAKFLCEWARLSKEEFLVRASEVIQETHDYVMEVSDMRAALQRNIDSARREGAESDDEVLAVIAERYRQMLRSLNECETYLRL